ncbi:carbohydrate sulfotransferase 1-like isoform X3 [Palaemon carinicauda]
MKPMTVVQTVTQPKMNNPPTAKRTSEGHNRPLFILLMSSSGRTGSTLMAKLLRTHGGSVVFFEPLFRTITMLNDPCHLNGTCVAQFLKDVALCKYTKDFEEWFKKWTVFFEVFHPEVSYCMQYTDDLEKCKKIDVRGRCLNSRVRIIKVIRSRMAWVEDLLKDDTLNMKLIYLTRDPRATLSSYNQLGWGNSAPTQCGDMKKDLDTYDRFERLYPKKVFRTQIETLSVDPYGTIRNLFGFLFGTPVVEDETVEFVNKHMRAKSTVYGGLKIEANSTEEYQSWRWEITQEILNASESNAVCQVILKRLGHVVFGSLKRARDRNVKLLDYEKN